MFTHRYNIAFRVANLSKDTKIEDTFEQGMSHIMVGISIGILTDEFHYLILTASLKKCVVTLLNISQDEPDNITEVKIKYR